MKKQSEVTLLQYHAECLGTILERSPKCHPELAKEGVKYVWEMEKMFIGDHLLSKRDPKKNSRVFLTVWNWFLVNIQCWKKQ